MVTIASNILYMRSQEVSLYIKCIQIAYNHSANLGGFHSNPPDMIGLSSPEARTGSNEQIFITHLLLGNLCPPIVYSYYTITSVLSLRDKRRGEGRLLSRLIRNRVKLEKGADTAKCYIADFHQEMEPRWSDDASSVCGTHQGDQEHQQLRE